MRVVVVTLALLFLTGTQARYFWQHDEPQAPLDRLRDLVDVYLETVKASGKDAIAQFEASAVGKQLDLKLADNLDTLGAAAAKLREDMAPYYKEVREMWLKDTESLRAELTKDLEEVKEKIRPFLDQFSAKWTEELEQYRQRLAPVAQELKELTKQKVELMQQKLTPVAEEARDRLRGHVEGRAARHESSAASARPVLPAPSLPADEAVSCVRCPSTNPAVLRGGSCREGRAAGSGLPPQQPERLRRAGRARRAAASGPGAALARSLPLTGGGEARSRRPRGRALRAAAPPGPLPGNRRHLPKTPR